MYAGISHVKIKFSTLARSKRVSQKPPDALSARDGKLTIKFLQLLALLSTVFLNIFSERDFRKRKMSLSEKFLFIKCRYLGINIFTTFWQCCRPLDARKSTNPKYTPRATRFPWSLVRSQKHLNAAPHSSQTAYSRYTAYCSPYYPAATLSTSPSSSSYYLHPHTYTRGL